MTAIPVFEALDPGTLLSRLGWASLAGGLFVAAVWAVTRALPRLPAGLRCALWWTAGLKLLVALLWTAPLELPLLPAPQAAASPVDAVARAARAPGPLTAFDPAPDPAPGEPPVVAAAPAPAVPWRALLAGLWAAGLALGAVGLARELAAARRIRSRSRPADPFLAERFHGLRRRLGVQAAVELRLSDEAPGPLTLGLLRPAVVLPARDAVRLSPQELDMALAHELLHVRRRDLWAGWVPLLARRLFFFHPLAALAAREYLVAREAACDAGVLRELGAAPRSYGRLLLLWTRSASDPATGGVTAAGASPTFLELKRRLVMLQNPSPPSWRLRALGGALAALALAALLPIRLVALPAQQEAPEPARTSGSSWSYADDGEAWALLEPGGNAWMNGSSRDMGRIRALSAGSEPLLWFRRDGREYLVRDPAFLEQVRAVLEPQRELGRRQGELGGRQGELGAEQGELGARQGELGAQQAELGAEQGRLGAEMAGFAAERARLHTLRLDADRERRAELEAREDEIEERMERLGDQMEELGRRQAELGRRQAELGRQQGALGSRQAQLGAQQAELGERQRQAAQRAQAQLREMFDRAVAQGLAERVE